MESLREISRLMRQIPTGETACYRDFPLTSSVQPGECLDIDELEHGAAISFPHPVKATRLSSAQAHAQTIRILAQQSGTCALCGGMEDWRGWQRDHIKTRGQGGTDNDSNIRVVCARCHFGRHGVTERVAQPMWSRR